MNFATRKQQAPWRVRLVWALMKERDWSAMSAAELASFSDTENRKRSSPLLRVVTGFPDRGAVIDWQELGWRDRRVRVRVYRPRPARHPVGGDLPLVVHVHGGGFVGTAAQSDWLNSYLAAQLPAVVVSIEHRLLGPGVPLAVAVDDGWDALSMVMEQAEQWATDPARVAVVGESAGGAIAALIAIRAREDRLALRAQILVNSCLDVTSKMYDHPSMTEYAVGPIATRPELQLFARLAAPPGTDPRLVSPLQADNLSGLPPALVVVPTVDHLADHGRRYAERLQEAGTEAVLSEYPGSTHGFLSTPGLVSQAKLARAEIIGFLRSRLGVALVTRSSP